MAHHLTRPVGPINNQRQINFTGFFHQFTRHTRHIGFFCHAVFKLHRQMPLGMGGQCKNHHAGCITVQPVHQQRIRKRQLNTGQQAIGQVRTAPRHR